MLVWTLLVLVIWAAVLEHFRRQGKKSDAAYRRAARRRVRRVAGLPTGVEPPPQED